MSAARRWFLVLAVGDLIAAVLFLGLVVVTNTREKRVNGPLTLASGLMVFNALIFVAGAATWLRSGSAKP